MRRALPSLPPSWWHHHSAVFRNVNLGMVLEAPPRFDGAVHEESVSSAAKERTAALLRLSRKGWGLHDAAPREVRVAADPVPMRRDGSREQFLGEMQRFGFCVVDAEDASEGAVQDLLGWMLDAPEGERARPMRTIYGSVFKLEAEPDPSRAINLAYTQEPLGFHQDLTYYHTPPAVQTIFCMESAADGGGVSFVKNAYAAAEAFRREEGDAFRVLSRQPVAFQKVHHRRAAPVHLVREVPIMELGHDGASLRRVNWSPLLEGFTLAEGAPAWEAFYAAYHAWAAFLDAWPAFSVLLRPGQALAFHNQHLLHARSAFHSRRVCRGFYLSAEQWQNAQAVARFASSAPRSPPAAAAVRRGAGEHAALHAAAPAAQGETLVAEVSPLAVGAPHRYTLQRLPGLHLEIASELRYANHSFAPSARIEFDEDDLFAVRCVAERDIAEGEEITIDYERTEDSLAEPFLDGGSGKWVGGRAGAAP